MNSSYECFGELPRKNSASTESARLTPSPHCSPKRHNNWLTNTNFTLSGHETTPEFLPQVLVRKLQAKSIFSWDKTYSDSTYAGFHSVPTVSNASSSNASSRQTSSVFSNIQREETRASSTSPSVQDERSVSSLEMPNASASAGLHPNLVSGNMLPLQAAASSSKTVVGARELPGLHLQPIPMGLSNMAVEKLYRGFIPTPRGTGSGTLRINATVTNTLPQTNSQSGFIPMLAITRPDKTGKDLTPIPLTSQSIELLKFSPRYHGMHTENNASVEYLAPEQNCALWLTNLPPDVTETELLGAIRNVGRIYATYINYPDFVTHKTSAAKVVFFTPDAAQKLLAQTLAIPLVIRGHQVKMALNRIKYAQNSIEKGESRVLIITGHKDLVNEKSLTKYFAERFAFQVDQVQTLIQHENRAVVEYKFGSYRCQSQMGMKALLLDRPEGFEMVEYGADPCEVGSDLTSFTIAAERIQGKGLVGAG